MGQPRGRKVVVGSTLLFLAILCSLLSSPFLGQGLSSEIVAFADHCTYTVSSDRELQAANASVRPGEVVCLRSGTYYAAIDPSRSGSPDGGWIAYQALSGERAVMVASVDLSGKSYLIIEGILFESDGHTWVDSDTDSHHIRFLGCEFDSSQPGSGHGLAITGDYFTVRDSVFGDWWVGDMVYIQGSHALIEHNDFSQARGSHSLISLKGTHTIVRRNYFRNPWDRAMTIGWKGDRKAERILVEGNVFIDNNWDHSEPHPDEAALSGADQAVKFNVSRSIFRNNLIVHTNEGKDYDYASALSFSTYGEVLHYEHLRVYHNTFYQNRNNAIALTRNTDDWYTTDVKFKNNVIAESEGYAFKIVRSDLAWASYLFDTNLIYDSTKKETLYIRDGGLAQTVYEAQSSHPDVFLGNIAAAPQFRDVSLLDDADTYPARYRLDQLDDLFHAFSLQDASAGQGDGAFLSVVTASATGATTVDVDDALFFSDGLGLIPGDSILIGGNGPVRVVQVVDDTTLMVDRAIDVHQGDEIYLEPTGPEPDIGIYAFGSGTVTPPPLPSLSPPGGGLHLYPVADAFVTAESPSQNYGDSVQLEVDGEPAKVAYLAFDLSSLSRVAIEAAVLRFRVTDHEYSSSDSIQAIKVVDDAWLEGDLTYDTRPDLGDTVATINGGTAGTFGEVDLTTLVQSRAGQLLSLGIESAGSDGLDLYSKEHPVADERPALIVRGALHLYPVADTFVSAESPSRNYGQGAQLEVDGEPAKVAYLAFDLSPLSGVAVEAAVLRFRVTDHEYGSSDSIQYVKVVDDGWSEAEVTYEARPDLGDTVATISGGTAGSLSEVDLTTLVQSRAGGFLSLGIESTGSDGLDFYSKEYSIAGHSPVLMVTLAP